MNEQLWSTSENPLDLLNFCRHEVTVRQLRRFALACHRRLIPIRTARDRQWFIEAEKFADGDQQALEWAQNLAGGHFSIDWESGPEHRGWRKNIRWEPAFFWRVALPEVTPDDRERAAQCDLFREIVGNPFRPVYMNTGWLLHNDCTVLRIAQSIYDEQRFGRLPVLADALEEAGGSNHDILAHLREDREHVRGCWALGLCLGHGLVHRDIIEGDGRLTEGLVKTGVSLDWIWDDVSDEREDDPLISAIAAENVTALRALLSLGGVPNVVGADGEVPMNVAARTGNREVIQLLLDAGASVNDRCLQTPLYDAVSSKHLEVAEWLLREGADPNATDERGYSPLMIAVIGNDLPAVKLLMQFGASLSVKPLESYYDGPILGRAIEHDSPEAQAVVSYLRQFATPEEIAEAEAHCEAVGQMTDDDVTNQ